MHSKVYAAHALDKDIIVMTQTKNIVASTKYCDLGEETDFVALEVAPVLLVGTNLAGKLVGGMNAEYLKYSSTKIAKCKIQILWQMKKMWLVLEHLLRWWAGKQVGGSRQEEEGAPV